MVLCKLAHGFFFFGGWMAADTLTRDRAIASRDINGRRFKGLESDSWDTIDVCFPGPVGAGKS